MAAPRRCAKPIAALAAALYRGHVVAGVVDPVADPGPWIGIGISQHFDRQRHRPHRGQLQRQVQRLHETVADIVAPEKSKNGSPVTCFDRSGIPGPTSSGFGFRYFRSMLCPTFTRIKRRKAPSIFLETNNL